TAGRLHQPPAATPAAGILYGYARGHPGAAPAAADRPATTITPDSVAPASPRPSRFCAVAHRPAIAQTRRAPVHHRGQFYSPPAHRPAESDRRTHHYR